MVLSLPVLLLPGSDMWTLYKQDGGPPKIFTSPSHISPHLSLPPTSAAIELRPQLVPEKWSPSPPPGSAAAREHTSKVSPMPAPRTAAEVRRAANEDVQL